MKIFGIGLNKTGTTSLGKAVEILGYKEHVSCDLDLLKLWDSGDFEPIFQVADMNNNFEDWPWPLLYKELYRRYPDAKFILTVRQDAETWFSSLCKHALRTGPTDHRKIVYGYAMPQENPEAHMRFYNKHNAEVKTFFKSNNNLHNFIQLCWKKDNNWDQICSFLDKPRPKVDFPYLNKSNTETKKSFWHRIGLKYFF